MAERRALIEGLKGLDEDIDADLAEEFISVRKTRSPAKTAAAAPMPKAPPTEPQGANSLPPLPDSVMAAAQASAPSPLTAIGRVPVGARVRTDLASALKRASLQRQLNGIQPYAVQEILEEALELWLLKNGHPLK